MEIKYIGPTLPQSKPMLTEGGPNSRWVDDDGVGVDARALHVLTQGQFALPSSMMGVGVPGSGWGGAL